MDVPLMIEPAARRGSRAWSRLAAASEGRPPPLRVTSWVLVLALLVGAACAPVGAGARAAQAAQHPCGVAEGGPGARDASATPSRAGSERGTPPAACLRHCRSAEHGLQSAAPKAASLHAPLAMALQPASLALLLPRGGVALVANGPCGPARASPRPLLHCALLL